MGEEAPMMTASPPLLRAGLWLVSSGTLLSTLDAVCTGVPLLGDGDVTACSCDLDAASASDPGAGAGAGAGAGPVAGKADDEDDSASDDVGDTTGDGDAGPRSTPPPPSAPVATVEDSEGEGSGAPAGDDGSAMAVGSAVTPSRRSAFGTGDATEADCSGFIGVVALPPPTEVPLAKGDIGLAGDWARPLE